MISGPQQIGLKDCAVTEAPYDSRAIANLMLDEGQRHSRGITNLALQKLLYFAHGLFLVERSRPYRTCTEELDG